MIGTKSATVLFVVYLILATTLGVVAGRLTCLTLRHPWRTRVAFGDAVVAVVIAFVTAYVAASVEAAQGIWASNVTLVSCAAVVGVIVKHLVPGHQSSGVH